jgi:hypothetical protein
MKKLEKSPHYFIYAVIFFIPILIALVNCDKRGDADNTSTYDYILPGHSQEILIPEPSDWVDHGPILEKGKKGDWDYLLYGAFTGTVVKKDGTFYLYYQGAKDYSEKYGTVTYRGIGVATSQDGIHFTKFPDNPVLTWYPNNWLEEGAVSGGATLIPFGEIVMYYGANTKKTKMTVNADGRLAVSADGLNFSDHGVVLDHKNKAIWGSGDELFPIIAFQARENWYVYFIPNGTQHKGKLGLAWGSRRNGLQNTGPVLANGKTVNVWGMGGYAKIGTNTYALFLNNVRKRTMEVRFAPIDNPDRISKPVQKYSFEDFMQGTVFLDNQTNTWFMFYRAKNGGRYHAKSAPVRKIEDKKN